ncbi:Threonine-tRNA ligase, cytoplasmic [Smittium culicis]|uniref:Threonine--tRNA ligase, cytoplasmic n=1 Tax=Smittium culicis TaxID=133412 RepID=A0A1R1YCU2_9FUNG|nr:Threonine-tRNA ligase, cytoplasmic [Smittium culicis]
MEIDKQVKDLSISEPKPAPSKKKAPKGNVEALTLVEYPDYINKRIEIFDRLKKIQDDIISKKERVPIKITLPDGKVVDGTSYETTPMDIAKSISTSLAKKLVISKVNGELWDSIRPFETDSTLQLLDFESDEGKAVYWHSSAHVLGEACELRYGCSLCIGPPIDEGFYYEFGLPDSFTTGVSQADYAPIETLANKAIKEKQRFERLEVSKADLLDMFSYNKYKVQLIESKIPDNTSTTVYRCGPLIDLCRGPHLPDTGRIGSLAVTKNSSSYFLGDAKNDSLQRLYGISFPDKKQMTEYKKFLEEASKRDHRKIGKDQELFYFNELSPGSAFFLPHGARIYNTLQEYIRSEYWKRGFEEVVTPNIFNVKLWEKSGHWQNYRDDMFSLDVEKETFALKPMNCPSHCLIFGMRERSYRELPIRFADFGVLHRNEASGALTGLTRVRRFQQDDAHIFCTSDQVGDEISSCLSFLESVYSIFGFTFELVLSTRPEKFLGEINVWDVAEKQLADAMDKFGVKWKLNPGDGAFYGPKIDITIKDALNRRFQCATIQLDFQLPIRFDLNYRAPADNSSDNSNDTSSFPRPIIIHRAILGSFERMIAILTENFAGRWPFWLSPRQLTVIPIAAPLNDYAQKVQSTLKQAGFYVDIDLGGETLNKKIRNAQLAQYNFILVVGKQEETEGSVNVRNRDDPNSAKGETILLEDFVTKIQNLKESKKIANTLE